MVIALKQKNVHVYQVILELIVLKVLWDAMMILIVMVVKFLQLFKDIVLLQNSVLVEMTG